MNRYSSLPPNPQRISRIEELAIDLWWSWHADAREVFRRLDYALWRATAITLLKHWPAQSKVSAALLQAASDTDALVRAVTAGAMEPLAHAVSPQIRATLNRLLNDPVRAVRVAAAWNVKRPLKPGRLDELCGSAELVILRNDFRPESCPAPAVLTGEDFARGGSAELYRWGPGRWGVVWAQDARGRRPWSWGPVPRTTAR